MLVKNVECVNRSHTSEAMLVLHILLSNNVQYTVYIYCIATVALAMLCGVYMCCGVTVYYLPVIMED